MRLLAAFALLAATCTKPAPIPAPEPIPDPVPDEGDDAGAPVPEPAPVPTPIPDSTCEAVFDHLGDLECPPAESHAGFLTKCAGFSSGALSCLLATDTCAVARACLER